MSHQLNSHDNFSIFVEENLSYAEVLLDFAIKAEDKGELEQVDYFLENALAEEK